MLSVRDLWELVDRHVRPLEPRRTPLAETLGCRLCEDVRADVDLPAFTRSAIDGFAVRAGSGEGRYRVAGEVRPGQPAGGIPAAGTAVRIFTGSALPDEGVELVMVEDAEAAGEDVIFRKASEARLVRPRASQARSGEVLWPAGEKITPGAIALLATVGKARPLIAPRPRVAHLSTGSELVAPDCVPPPGCIRDSNSPLLAALIAEAGAELVFQTRVSERIEDALAVLENLNADVLLISGGASVGAYDGTAEILRRLGFQIHSSQVKSRPGKPLIFATCGGQAAFGLPGNPLSHFVCFHLFVRRALDVMTGSAPRELVQVHVDETPAPDPRETWWPARLRAEGGQLRAKPLPWTDSSDLTGLPAANALLRVPAEKTNALAEALLFGTLAA
jgi:molybdopterin molybdotransferase